MGLFSSREEPKPQNRTVDTVIGAGATFDGELKTENSVCVEGTFKGSLESGGRVILNQSGTIQADVTAEYLTVNGVLEGNVKALQQLDLGETGHIRGDVEAGAVTVARGGLLEGTCRMIRTAEAPAKATAAVDTPAPKKPVAASETDHLKKFTVPAPGGATAGS